MRRRAAVFVLLLGGVLALGPLIGATPDERRFVVTLPMDRGRLSQLELVWRDAEGDVVRRLEQRFPRGAPREIERSLRLAPGRYWLDIMAEGDGRRVPVTRVIDVQEDTSEVRVQVP